MRDGATLSERCCNRWEDILRGIGIPQQIFNRKSQPCPLCPGGTDRFTWDNKGGNGSFICRKCGAGDGIELVKRYLKVDFKEAARVIEGLIGSSVVRAPLAAPDNEKQKRAMMELWKRSAPLMGEDIVSRYLRARGIALEKFPNALRSTNDLAYFDGKSVMGYFPAMIANFRAPDNGTGILHRTYLQEPGVKADVPKQKMFMPGRIPAGGAVRLGPVAETMGIAEGIETALAASIIHKIPVWATLSAGAMTKWEPPLGIRSVVIFADLDATFTGQTSAYQLATRLIRCEWADKGKKERIAVEVRSPLFSDTGHYNDDWNDILKNTG